MTSHRERAEKFLRSIMTRSPCPDEISHVESAFREVEAQALERAAKWVDEAMECDYCQGEYYSDGIRALIGEKEPV